MNNRIKTIIITITAIALAFGLLVSCDGNVITTRNNKLAYTEVLETGGGFVYKGQSYDLLSDILNVIRQEGSQEEPIRVTGNVSMRPVTIPEGMSISLDLGGNEIRFFDVKDSAVKAAGEGTVLNLSNGALSLAKDDAELAVIGADGAEAINLSALEIKADGQIALDLNGVKDTKLEEDVSVSGAVIVRGGEDSTRLTIANELSDVRMNGATLVIADNGKAVITENLPDHSDNSYVVSPSAALIDHTGTIKPEDIHTGVCYIVRERTYYYGSLREAVQSLGEGDAGATITFFADDENAADIELNIPVTIDLAGHSVTAANNITLADRTDLTIKNSSTISTSYFTGTVTSAEGGTSSLSVVGDVVMNNEINVTGSLTGEGATFKDDITASGNIDLTGSKFDSGTETHPAVTSTNGDICMANISGTAGDIKTSGDGKTVTISNTPEADVALTTGGLISEGGSVTVIGSSATKPVTVNGDVSVSGALTSSNAVFKGNVNAETITDGSTEPATPGSVFKGNISADGDISLTGSTFNSGTATAPNVTSENGDISMANVSGTAGAITANGEDGSGNVAINNSGATQAFTIGAISAEDGISVTGKSGLNVSVTESIEAGSSFTGNYCQLGDGNTDHIYAPSVSVSNSTMNLGTIAGGQNTPADSVSIIGPQSGSHINSLNTNGLSVTDSSNNLAVDTVTLGGNGTNNTVNGGTYGSFAYNGTTPGKLTVSAGNFGSNAFNHNGSGSLNISGGVFDGVLNHNSGSGSLVISGGAFTDFSNAAGSGASLSNGANVTVKGSNSDRNLDTVNKFLGMIGNAVSATINYEPTDLIVLGSGDAHTFANTAGGTGVLNFMNTVSSGVVSKGIVVDSDIASTNLQIKFGTGNTMTADSRIYVRKGKAFESNANLDGGVYKIDGDNKVGDLISATEPNYSYIFPEILTVTFNANGGSVEPSSKTVMPGETYGDLPVPTYTDKGFEGWYTAQTGGTKVNSTTTVTATADHTLWAHWGDLSDFVTIPSQGMIISSCPLNTYDINGNPMSKPSEYYCIPTDSSAFPDGAYCCTNEDVKKVKGVKGASYFTVLSPSGEGDAITSAGYSALPNSAYFGDAAIKNLGMYRRPNAGIRLYFYDGVSGKVTKYYAEFKDEWINTGDSVDVSDIDNATDQTDKAFTFTYSEIVTFN